MTAPVELAANEWRVQLAGAERSRDALIVAVRAASAAGVSEYQIAAAAGVTRQTVRVWLGKGDR